MEILLIRHGDPDYADDGLTPRGHEQAQRLARYLSPVALAAIYQSPFGRARQTCAYTARAQGMEPVTLEWLSEVGIMRGELYLWNAPGPLFLCGDSLPHFEGCLEPGGEMPEGKGRFLRVSRGFDEIIASYGYTKRGHMYQVESSSAHTIALFCHAGVILTLLSYLLHWPMPLVFVHCRVDPTGVTHLELVEREGLAHARIVALNSLAHLG